MDEVWPDPTGKPWMFSGVSHFPVYWYPDPAHPLAQLHRTLAQQLAPEHVDIMNATDDLSTAVVRISSGARPTMFLVVDVKTATSITGMHTFPKLRGRRLSSVEAIEFRARDGLAIRGYLTTPLDSTGKPRDGLPLLVMSHGGPRGEVADSRYDVERQLFASRGYAVLEVNARGSVGRGAAFEQAGDGRWGREVQDDFADAVRWAVKDGVAAAGRTCFYGTGYGAHSAMIAAAREPNLFQCVIGVAGIYDLPQMVQTMESSVGAAGKSLMDYFVTAQHLTGENLRMLQEESETGRRRPIELQRQTRDDGVDAFDEFLRKARESALSPLPPDEADLISLSLLLQRAFGSDMEELEARSPISHAPSIKAKVLLLHQHLDKQLPWEQAQAMNSALRSAGNRAQIDTIGLADEGYFTVATRTAVYTRMLRFLDQHIGQ
jgi:dipeptidyl aminopeptidase/acylaminoacyl peptidase